MNWFTRNQPAPKTPATPVATPSGGGVTGAIVDLKKTIDNMSKRRELLEKKCLAEQKKALEFKNKGNRTQALMCLKRKKMWEKEIEKLVNVTFNLEQQAASIESSQITVDVVESQKQYSSAMKTIAKQVNADAVADLTDDIHEQMALHDEVSDILAQNTGLDDADDLETELEELMKEDEEEQLDTGVTDFEFESSATRTKISNQTLPTAPYGDIRPVRNQAVDDDEAALRELEAELAG